MTHSLTPIVYGVAALLFAASAYNTLSIAFSQSDPLSRKAIRRRRRKQESSQLPPISTNSGPGPGPSPKPTSHSVVTATYLVTPEMCAFPTPTSTPTNSGSLPFLRAGPLLKLIDICAGISSRRHASTLCVTISVDSVLILKPVYLGELIHISSCVNRAWNTSLEVGVRVVKENAKGQKEYVSHAYLTFVSLPKRQIDLKASQGQNKARFEPPQGVRVDDHRRGTAVSGPKDHPTSEGRDHDATFFSRLYTYLTYERPLPETISSQSSEASATVSPKPTLPKVIPSNRLEKRRHLLAGLRRTKRISNSKKGETRDGVSLKTKESVRKEVMEIGERMVMRVDDRSNKSGELDRFELEFIARAYLASDPAVAIDRSQVPHQLIVTLEGDEPLKRSLDEVERVAERFRKELEQDSQVLDLPNEGRNSNEKLSISEASDDKRRTSLGPLSPALDQVGQPEPHILMQDRGSIPTFRRGKSRNRQNSWDWERAFVSGGGVGIGLSDSISEDPLISETSLGCSISKSETIKEEDVEPEEASTVEKPRPAKTGAAEGLASVGKSLSGRCSSIRVEDTLVRSIHLVFPEHANSASVLFGGQLMAWMESCAILSCLKLLPSSPSPASSPSSNPSKLSFNWSTVSMDGLEFQKAASIGEVMEFTSVVTRTFTRSCEVYVLVTAESQGEGKRFTNDVLLTLACSAVDLSLQQQQQQQLSNGGAQQEDCGDGVMSPLKEVNIEKERYPALWEFSGAAGDRREKRLEMRELLSSVYR